MPISWGHVRVRCIRGAGAAPLVQGAPPGPGHEGLYSTAAASCAVGATSRHGQEAHAPPHAAAWLRASPAPRWPAAARAPARQRAIEAAGQQAERLQGGEGTGGGPLVRQVTGEAVAAQVAAPGWGGSREGGGRDGGVSVWRGGASAAARWATAGQAQGARLPPAPDHCQHSGLQLWTRQGLAPAVALTASPGAPAARAP